MLVPININSNQIYSKWPKAKNTSHTLFDFNSFLIALNDDVYCCERAIYKLERIDLATVMSLGMSRICFLERISFQGENLISDASFIQLRLHQWGTRLPY